VKRWKISHKLVFSFCSVPTQISVFISNLKERECFCLSVSETTEKKGVEDGGMEVQGAGHQLRT